MDGSTLDNVFTPSTTLRNYCELLRPGGRLLAINAFSSYDNAYVIMPPMWYLDYFVINKFADARIYVILYLNGTDNVLYLDLDFLQDARRGMGRFRSPYHMATLVFAEKGPDSTTDRLPNQQDYRSQEEWDVFCRNLAVMQRSRRPHLARSHVPQFFTEPAAGGHLFIEQNFTARSPEAVPTFAVATQSAELPALPWLAQWDSMIGLSAKPVKGPQIVSGQTILELVAVPSDECHSLAVRFRGLTPGGAYRVTAWVKAASGANARFVVRDSATSEADLRFDLTASSVIRSEGTLSAHGIESASDEWQKMWADLITADGQIFVTFGLLEAGGNSHVFPGTGQQVVLGGIGINAL